MYVSIIVCSACIEWSVSFPWEKMRGNVQKDFFLYTETDFPWEEFTDLKLWQLAPVSTTTALPAQ